MASPADGARTDEGNRGRYFTVCAYILILMACFVAYSPIVQYGPVTLELMMSGKVSAFQLSQENLNSTGALRYSRDFVIVLGVLLIVTLPFRNSSRFQKLAVWISGVIALGSIGHLLVPRMDLFVAGMRWVVLLAFMGGLVIVIMECSDWLAARLVTFASFLLLVLAIATAAGLIVQWSILGFARIYLDMTSIFQSKSALEWTTMGILVVVLPGTMRAHWKIAAFLILFFIGAASRSRLLIMAVALFGLGEVVVARLAQIARIDRRRRILMFALAATCIVGLVPATANLASVASGRRSILQDQLNRGGRVANLIDLPRRLEQGSPRELLLGKGFGYATNAAQLTTNSAAYDDPWMHGVDNAFVTALFQTGLLGDFVLFAPMIIFVISAYRAQGAYVAGQLRVAVMGAMFLLCLFSSNAIEQSAMMVCSGIAIAWRWRDGHLRALAAGTPSR